MQNRSTPDYWFEKAHQCFRRSGTDSNVRDALEALGNAFMVKAVELDIKLQKLANDNSTASSPARARRMVKMHFDRTTIQLFEQGTASEFLEVPREKIEAEMAYLEIVGRKDGRQRHCSD